MGWWICESATTRCKESVTSRLGPLPIGNEQILWFTKTRSLIVGFQAWLSPTSYYTIVWISQSARQAVKQSPWHFWFCYKVQQVYSSLGTSCHNAYTRFQLLLAHVHSWNIPTIQQGYRRLELRSQSPNVYMHEQSTIGIWCTYCGRKYLKWCTPFGPYSQCVAVAVRVAATSSLVKLPIKDGQAVNQDSLLGPTILAAGWGNPQTD